MFAAFSCSKNCQLRTTKSYLWNFYERSNFELPNCAEVYTADKFGDEMNETVRWFCSFFVVWVLEKNKRVVDVCGYVKSFSSKPVGQPQKESWGFPFTWPWLCKHWVMVLQLTPNLLEQNDVPEYLDQNYESNFLSHWRKISVGLSWLYFPLQSLLLKCDKNEELLYIQ